jgi:hypothetical protein
MGVLPTKLKRAAVLALLAAVAAAIAFRGPPPCPFWALGFPCPSCGLTRALLLAARGDLAAAWIMNPFWPFWAFIGAAVLAGFILFIFGAIDMPETPGRWAMGKLSGASAWLIIAAAWSFNLYSKGFNHDGILWRVLHGGFAR